MDLYAKCRDGDFLVSGRMYKICMKIEDVFVSGVLRIAEARRPKRFPGARLAAGTPVAYRFGYLSECYT